MKNSIKILVLVSVTFFSSCDREAHFNLHRVGNNYVQHYSWWYNNKLYNMNLSFPVDVYLHYHTKPKTLDYADYALEDPGFKNLGYIANSLNELVAQDHLSDLELTNYVMAFVQQGM